MNKEMRKFPRKNPKNKDEKLICELASDLKQTMLAFINLNKLATLDEQLFIILRDGALSYAGQTIEMLTKMLSDKTQIAEFIAEAHDIFNCYLKQARELADE